MRGLIPHRILRATVWVVLGVWLFALGAGMANACLLEPQPAHEHRQQTHDTGNRHVHAGHAGASDHHHEGTSKAPCVKVCGDATQSPVQKSPTTTIDLMGVPPSSFEPWIARWVDLVVDVWSTHALPPPAPPPRLLFTRLAL